MDGRRVHERFERRLRVIVSHEGGKIECVTRNISLGGMYLVTESRLPYGTPVTLEFHLPALAEDVELKAVIRWEKDDGFGVSFLTMRAREVWGLNQLLKDDEASD
ncbi:MAG: PilZ domain-containing protein [Sandaracinaceae bacterium]